MVFYCGVDQPSRCQPSSSERTLPDLETRPVKRGYLAVRGYSDLKRGRQTRLSPCGRARVTLGGASFNAVTG